MLSRRAGVQHIEAVEDAVQSALMTALEAWTIAGLPDNPSAWLFRVAQNDLMGELRQRRGRRRILEQNADQLIGTQDSGSEGTDKLTQTDRYKSIVCSQATATAQRPNALSLRSR